LFCLLLKTTHKLQPLNVGMFSVLQHTWNVHCSNLAAKRITVDHYNFIPEYLAICKKVITPDLIIKAFWKTGIFPFNPSIFSEQDFGPSMVLSSTLHLLSSYPNPTPFSPPAIPTDNKNTIADFIPECLSDIEIDSSDKDDSDNEGCKDKVCDNFRCIVSFDEIQPTLAPPLLNSDTLHTTPTNNQYITGGAPPEYQPPISQPRDNQLLLCHQNTLAFQFLSTHPHSPYVCICHHPHLAHLYPFLKYLTGRRPLGKCSLKCMVYTVSFPR